MCAEHLFSGCLPFPRPASLAHTSAGRTYFFIVWSTESVKAAPSVMPVPDARARTGASIFSRSTLTASRKWFSAGVPWAGCSTASSSPFLAAMRRLPGALAIHEMALISILSGTLT